MKGNSSALRKGRFSESGRIYLVTFVTHQRTPIFHDFGCGRIVVSSMRFLTTLSDTLAYVIMPDHVHWLVELRDGSLERSVHSLKSFSAKEINKKLGWSGHIWQKGFHDHAIRDEEDLTEIARYIVMNPIRAGLVKSCREYALWDAVWV
ncbi:REP-associated tyrosine transposase [Amphritea pacifica]|uniref:Transposase n=1 Tax=Amphritea pacifica TaxID=2811233 RepID=A0ABS2W7R3_9GAMM|nr:transposase [Amphritea pacifica]MBN0987752.1 transposase [Amphritea pacifica]